jgi:hypothetical protein
MPNALNPHANHARMPQCGTPPPQKPGLLCKRRPLATCRGAPQWVRDEARSSVCAFCPAHPRLDRSVHGAGWAAGLRNPDAQSARLHRRQSGQRDEHQSEHPAATSDSRATRRHRTPRTGTDSAAFARAGGLPNALPQRIGHASADSLQDGERFAGGAVPAAVVGHDACHRAFRLGLDVVALSNRKSLQLS